MTTTSVLLLVVGLLLGLAVGLFATRRMAHAQGQVELSRADQDAQRARADLATAQAEASRARAQEAEARAQTERVRTEVARLEADLREVDAAQERARAEVADARALAAAANAERAEVAAQLASTEAQRDAAVQRAVDLSADRDALVDRFKVLSTETLERQGKAADASADQRLKATEQLMGPVKEGLEQMNRRLQEVEQMRVGYAAELREQVRSVVVTGENLRRETNALSTALRKPQVRGAWGELQLKRVVEIAGMTEHCDFVQQATTQTSTDATIRPDMKVMLGDGKFVYVDSKVPLSAFLDAQEATDEKQREASLRSFARNVKGHVDQLSAKTYWKADAGTPEFTVLFVPSEALAAEALSQMPDLHEYAAGKNIILASPSTLIGMLRAIAYSWRQAALANSAAEVFTLGRELYDRLATMGSNVDKLGRSLQSSLKAYNATVASLEGRVMVTARRFRDLQVTDAELHELGAVDEPLRQISAPELVEHAGSIETIIGRADQREERGARERGNATGRHLEQAPGRDDDQDGPGQPSLELA